MTASESPFLRATTAGRSAANPDGGPTPPERCQNFLAAGARFDGTLIVEDSVRLEGHFTGDIQTRGTLQVSQGARVEASVHASYVVIAGAFKGQIDSRERVDLLPAGRVKGDLRTRRLVVEDGAQFDGKIQMGAEETGRSK